jgi:hypothetical protein
MYEAYICAEISAFYLNEECTRGRKLYRTTEPSQFYGPEPIHLRPSGVFTRAEV